MKYAPVMILVLAVFCSQQSRAADTIVIKKLTGPASFTSDSRFPCLVEFEEDGEKKIMAAWAEEGLSLHNIYYSVKNNSPQGVWSDPEPAFKTAVTSKAPHLDLGPDGTVHMVWTDGVSRMSKEVYHGIYKNKKWSGGEMLIWHNGNDSFPRIDILDNGVVNVAWETEIAPFDNSALVMVNTWTINNSLNEWDSRGHNVSTNHQDHNHATHGDLYCRGRRSYAVWQEGEPGRRVIMFTEKLDNGNWGWPIQISGDSHSSWPKVAVDSHYNVHVVYAKVTGKYHYVSRIFGKWTAPQFVNKSYATRTIPEIDIDENDTLHAAYRGDGENIFYNVKSANNLGAWGNHVRVSDGREAELPNISVDSLGYVHLVWGDLPVGASHSHDIWYATLERREDPTKGYPNADFSASATSILAGAEVSFDASASTSGGKISGYYWNFGDIYGNQNEAEGKQVTHTFTSKGEFKVTLSVLDLTIKKIGNKTITITVGDRPMPPLNPQISRLYTRGFITQAWRITISWQANPKNTALAAVEYYSVYRRIPGGNWAQLARVSQVPYQYVDVVKSSQDAQKYQYGVSVKLTGLEQESEIAVVSSTDESRTSEKSTKIIKK